MCFSVRVLAVWQRIFQARARVHRRRRLVVVAVRGGHIGFWLVATIIIIIIIVVCTHVQSVSGVFCVHRVSLKSTELNTDGMASPVESKHIYTTHKGPSTQPDT